MRGKDFHRSGFQTSDRITPAWAGKRRSGFVLAPAPTDHPRVGGEKPEWTSLEEIERGSPPRGRGKARLLTFGQRPSRLTPAWAGKRGRAVGKVGHRGDHPRAGGEKHWMMILVLEPVGSPPRGRGKAGRRRIGGQAVWITPAWAGKSLTIPKLTTRSWDHPRVGGEKFFLVEWNYKQKDHPRVGGEKVMLFTVSVHALGSPPRGRGKVLL